MFDRQGKFVLAKITCDYCTFFEIPNPFEVPRSVFTAIASLNFKPSVFEVASPTQRAPLFGAPCCHVQQQTTLPIVRLQAGLPSHRTQHLSLSLSFSRLTQRLLPSLFLSLGQVSRCGVHGRAANDRLQRNEAEIGMEYDKSHNVASDHEQSKLIPPSLLSSSSSSSPLSLSLNV